MKLATTLTCVLFLSIPTVLWAAPTLVDPETQSANAAKAQAEKEASDTTERYRTTEDTQRQKSTQDTQRQTSTTDSARQIGTAQERQKGQPTEQREKSDSSSSQRRDSEVNVQ